MGNTSNKELKTYNARNGDKMTILYKADRASVGAKESKPDRKWHVNIQKCDEEEWHNELMSGVEIYQWFDTRGTMAPKAFLFAEKLLEQQHASPRPHSQRKNSKFLSVISPRGRSSNNLRIPVAQRCD